MVKINIPNLLTILRILLVPVFIILIINYELKTALLVFILAAITDSLDGLIARVFNQKTKLGAYLDPVADKLLLVSAYVILAVQNILPNWLTVIVVSRDVIILFGIVVLVVMGKPVEIKPSMISKTTTGLQILTVVFVIAWFNIPSIITSSLIPLTAVFTIASGIYYIYRGVEMLN